MNSKKKKGDLWDYNRKKVTIKIPSIKLNWSDWIPWNTLKKGGVKIPDTSGVYEVRHKNRKKLLTIGRSRNLKDRIVGGLVKGTKSHSAGKEIRKKEDVSKIVIRWAKTERPATVEEELHLKHSDTFGCLPKYVKQPTITLQAKERRSHGK